MQEKIIWRSADLAVPLYGPREVVGADFEGRVFDPIKIMPLYI